MSDSKASRAGESRLPLSTRLGTDNWPTIAGMAVLAWLAGQFYLSQISGFESFGMPLLLTIVMAGGLPAVVWAVTRTTAAVALYLAVLPVFAHGSTHLGLARGGPFLAEPWPYGGVAGPVLVAIALLAGQATQDFVKRRISVPKLPRSLTVFIALFVIGATASVLASPSFKTSWEDYVEGVICPLLGLALIVFTIHTYSDLRRIALGLAACAGTTMAMGFYGFLKGGMWEAAVTSIYSSQVAGLAFYNASYATQVMFLTLPFALFVANQSSYPRSVRALAYLVVLGILPWSAISMKRGAWLAVAVLVVILLLTKRWRRLGLVMSFSCVAALVVVGHLLPDLFVARSISLAAFHYDIALLARGRAYVAALKMVGAYPLTGIGLGRFIDVYPTYAPTVGVYKTIFYAHNLFLHVAAEAGLVALTGLIGVLTWHFYQGKSIMSQASTRGLKEICTCSMLAVGLYLLYAVTAGAALTSTTHFMLGMLLLWVNVGIVVVGGQLHAKQRAAMSAEEGQ